MFSASLWPVASHFLGLYSILWFRKEFLIFKGLWGFLFIFPVLSVFILLIFTFSAFWSRNKFNIIQHFRILTFLWLHNWVFINSPWRCMNSFDSLMLTLFSYSDILIPRMICVYTFKGELYQQWWIFIFKVFSTRTPLN